MRSLAAALLCLAALPAEAGGFAIQDLSSVADVAMATLGKDYQAKAEAKRLTLLCKGCAGMTAIDVLLGRQDDGTEARVRSGATPIAKLEALCKAKSPDCRLTGLSVAPAVGWMTTYAIGSKAGSTAVIIRDGDLLTIRSIADSPEVASRNAKALVDAIAPRIIGR